MTFKKLLNGYYKCDEYPNYSIKKVGKTWVGYDTEKMSGCHICCNGTTLREVKNTIVDYIINGCWYDKEKND